ncbi:MAG: DNA adenine methylase [Candidatus Paceibacterota bacterium]
MNMPVLEDRKNFVKPSLFSNDPVENLDLSDPFFNSHLITYIGNKRRLAPFLYRAFLSVRERIGKEKMTILDGFVGSGASARILKPFASELHVNDMEDYSETINKAYLSNYNEKYLQELAQHIIFLNKSKLKGRNKPGFIETHYAPKNDNRIEHGERVFYTNKNARIIDNIRDLIEKEIPEEFKTPCLASLLIRASIHTNTSGVFKGFHKKDGVGHFGGRGENALSRITAEIELDMPIFSNFHSDVVVHKRDTNELVNDPSLPEFDLVYYDPPYNQHPYGSNYFMLNIINNGKPIEIQDGVSGIAKEWNKSAYNKRRVAEDAMDRLIENTNARFIVISYNNEGLIPIDTFRSILSKYGKWELFEQDYNTYRGSRNLRDRDIKVKEHLWILEKN